MDKYGVETYQLLEIKEEGDYRLVPEEELKLLILLANRSSVNIYADPKKTLGNTIRNYRKKKDLSQKRLADNIGITSVSMNRIEQGQHKPSSENLQNICVHLGDDFKALIKELGFTN